MATPLMRLVRKGSPDVAIGYVQGGVLALHWTEEDSPGAGSHTYALQIADQAGSTGGGDHAGMLSGNIVAAVVKR